MHLEWKSKCVRKKGQEKKMNKIIINGENDKRTKKGGDHQTVYFGRPALSSLPSPSTTVVP